MTLFENVVDEYDRGRPSYPDAVYEALGHLAGRRVLDIGAGTGIATRELLQRGADVVAVDAGPAMIRHAKFRSPELNAVVADGALLPVREHSVDVVCFAQSWHWLDPATRITEMHRVLRPNGRWAAWWSHADIVGTEWLEAYWTEIENACAGAERTQAYTDWGPTIADPALFEPAVRLEVPWVRHVTADDWITDQASHSYVATLADEPRATLLRRLRTIVQHAFPTGAMQVPFVTRLWIAATK
jgi:SAM-dependent methyltransferase